MTIMWIFGRHRHLSHEVLSEYLDGRLHGAQRERVSRQLNSCAFCQEELESLRATISLLGDLPDVPAPRSFTLAAPPRVAATQSASRPFRAPSWAYAGAASLAGLALAVLVSADVTGLFTPSTPVPPQESFTAQAPQATPAPTPLASSAGPSPTPGPESDSAPQPDSRQALRAAKAPKSDAEPSEGGATPEADQPPASDQEAMTGAAAAPSAAPAEDAGPAGPEGTKGPGGPSGPAAGEVPTSEPGPVPQFAGGEMGTPLLWRVLEGVAAALLLVSLTVLVLQWRKARRSVDN